MIIDNTYIIVAIALILYTVAKLNENRDGKRNISKWSLKHFVIILSIYFLSSDIIKAFIKPNGNSAFITWIYLPGSLSTVAAFIGLSIGYFFYLFKYEIDIFIYFIKKDVKRVELLYLFLPIVICSILFKTATNIYLKHNYNFSSFDIYLFIGLLFSNVVLVPFFEEIFFRGVLLETLMNRCGEKVAIIINIIIFTAIHINKGILVVLLALLVSYFSIRNFISSQNIYYSILLHSLVNFLSVMLTFGFWSFVSYKMILITSAIILVPLIVKSINDRRISNIKYSI